jgi:hypothetical protein
LVFAAPILLAGGMALAGIASPMLAPQSGGPDPSAGDLSHLSPSETLSRSKQMSVQITNTEARVVALQKRAENKKDMVMVNCVSDKLVQLRGYVTLGNAAASAIETAIQRGDDGTRAHNLDRQVIIYQKVLVLGTEAEGCIGEDVSYVGATRVDVEIDPSIPVEDPTIPSTPVPTADRPPEGECPNA